MSTDGSSDSFELRFSEEHGPGSTELDRGNGSEIGGYRRPQESPFAFQNSEGLAHDLTFLAVMPEFCDVTFLVGEERQPVCGVKAIMAARSWVLRKQLYHNNGDGKKQSKKLLKVGSDSNMEKSDLKRGNGNTHQHLVVVSEFDPEVFKQVVEYLHTGSVMLQAHTILGLMNAADYYGLEHLKAACSRFVTHCITVETVCSLLSSAEKYIQYKTTKMVVQRILDFVDQNASAILSLGAFHALPQHVARIVLGREELQATELEKFEAAVRWCDANVDETNMMDLGKVFEPFADVVDYSQIPARELMQIVKPLRLVDDRVLLAALAYQANPSSVNRETRPRKTRSSPWSPRELLTLSPHMRRVQSSGVTLEKGGVTPSPVATDLALGLGRGGSVPPGSEGGGGGGEGSGGGGSNTSSPVAHIKIHHTLRVLEIGSRSGSRESHVSSSSSPILGSSGSVSSLSAVELTEGEGGGTPLVMAAAGGEEEVEDDVECRGCSVEAAHVHGHHRHCMHVDV